FFFLYRGSYDFYTINLSLFPYSTLFLSHYDFHTQTEHFVAGYLGAKRPLTVLLTSGASCPDAIVERVLMRLLQFFPQSRQTEEILAEYVEQN
ncbi:MAG: hypothetical protein AAFV07_17405, partial [Bacteroidota bacterium]